MTMTNMPPPDPSAGDAGQADEAAPAKAAPAYQSGQVVTHTYTDTYRTVPGGEPVTVTRFGLIVHVHDGADEGSYDVIWLGERNAIATIPGDQLESA